MKHLGANIPCLCGAKIYDTWHVRQCMECGARRHTHDKQVDVMYNFACDMLPGATVLSDAMLAGYFDDVIDGKHPDLPRIHSTYASKTTAHGNSRPGSNTGSHTCPLTLHVPDTNR